MFSDSSFVTICQLNCNGLSSHCVTAMDNFISQEKIEIISLQETGCHENEQPQFAGKSLFLKHVTHGVGLAINHTLVPQVVPDLVDPTSETLWILCRIDSKQVLIGSAYSPPSVRSLKPVLDSVCAAWRFCKSHQVSSMICMGDFNARCHTWGDHVQNPKGKELLHFLESKEEFLLSSPGTRTFRSMNPPGSSVIDLSISAGSVTAKLGNPWTIESVELFSGAPVRGHFPVLNKISIDQLRKTESRRRR